MSDSWSMDVDELSSPNTGFRLVSVSGSSRDRSSALMTSSASREHSLNNDCSLNSVLMSPKNNSNWSLVSNTIRELATAIAKLGPELESQGKTLLMSYVIMCHHLCIVTLK